jgi:phage-related protein
MSFFGFSFIYDGVSSELYGLVISSIGSSSEGESSMGSGINPITKKLLRNPVEYFYAVEQSPVLDFTMSVTSEYPISGDQRSLIGQWLFGQQGFKKLRILQQDLQEIYFDCIFMESSAIYVGNICRGFKIKVRSNSPFAWGRTVTRTKTFTDIANESLSLMNFSDNSYYTYPNLAFTTSGIGTYFEIINSTDGSRVMSFTNLSAGETITMDNARQIISSSTGLKRITKFNKHWLRLLPGVNRLLISGPISSYTIQYVPAKKIGG